MAADAKAVSAATATTPKLSDELAVLKPEIEKVLPEHVTPDKFMRVVLTAISQSPQLYRADRRSLLTSCIKAAQDGLLPDGREAALVIFRTRDKVLENGKEVERWVDKVQYMPMVAGILKKVRNSGELLSLSANVVYEKDTFRYWIDDAGEHITHEPNVLTDDRGKLRAVYAIAKTKDGGVYTEVMSRGQIEQVRNVSKAKDSGPWKDWYDEMARKTVIRRLAKRLPMSTDLEAVIRSDDELYDLQRPSAVSATTSGNAAVRQALGLLTEDMPGLQGVEAAEDQKAPTDAVKEKLAQRRASDALKKAPTVAALDKVWGEICADFEKTSRELPLDIDALYNDLREALAEREAMQGEGE